MTHQIYSFTHGTNNHTIMETVAMPFIFVEFHCIHKAGRVGERTERFLDASLWVQKGNICRLMMVTMMMIH